jgi:PKD repeat protein
MSWQVGQGVSLPYNGNRPDIGVFEWGGTSSLSAGASASTSSGQAPLTVHFTGSASGGNSPYTYRWTFGDGDSSNQKDPSHIYDESGSFTARLTVTDDSGTQDSASVNIHVSEPTPQLSVSASAAPLSGNAPLNVSFTGSVSGGNSPYTYSWAFGDGGSSSQKDPSHTYSESGSFTARLTVTDDNGTQDSASVNINVSEPTPQLSVSASATPLSGNAPLNVSFSGFVSGGSPPYTYSWAFGDGGSSTQKDPSHTYSQPGSYTATFTARDNAAQQRSATVGITVSSPVPGEARLQLSVSTGQPAGKSGGTITPSVGTHVFSLGARVQLRAKPNQGFRFARWTGDIGEEKIGHKNITIDLDRDKKINAAFCSQCGDVNGDLRLSPLDSQAVFDIFLGKIENATFCQSENADVNGDGSKTRPYISPADAQAIFVKYLGKGELPCDCSYLIRTTNPSTQSIQGGFDFSQIPPQDIHLGLDQLRRVSETEIHLPVMINNPHQIDAFGFDLVYPAEFLEFVGLAKTDMVKDFYQVDGNAVSEGVLRVGGYSSDPIMHQEGGELVLLIFKLVKKGVNGASDLYIKETFDDVVNAYYVKPNNHSGARKSRNYVRR